MRARWSLPLCHLRRGHWHCLPIRLRPQLWPHPGNTGLVRCGLPNFYAVPGWAMFMVTFTFVWKNLGYTFVIYLAALQGLDKELDEAAAIDGTGRWRKFWRVTMPQLRNTTFFLSITVLLNSVQVFDIINVMTRGGRRAMARRRWSSRSTTRPSSTSAPATVRLPPPSCSSSCSSSP